MKKIIFIFLTIGFVLCASAQSTDEYVESQKYHVDTVFENVDINGSKFNVKFLLNRSSIEKEGLYNAEEEDGNLPLTIAFFNLSSEKYDFVKDFSFEESNTYSYLSKWSKRNLSDSGLLYLKLNRSAGNTLSSRGKLYLISYYNNVIKLLKLFDYDYASLILYSKKNEILLLKGVFQNNFSGEEYKYSITKYTVLGDSSIEKKIGITKFKYAGWNGDKSSKTILKQMKLKESVLLKDVLLTDY